MPSSNTIEFHLVIKVIDYFLDLMLVVVIAKLPSLIDVSRLR